MKNTRAWYYVANDARVGPLDHEKLLALVANSQLKPETLVWAEGMENWETAKNHFAFPTAPPEVPSEPFNAGSTEPIPPALSSRVEATSNPAATDLGIDGLYIHAPSRGLIEAIQVCFRRYATFSGRASRSEYWFFVLFVILISLVTSVLDVIMFGKSFENYGPIYNISHLVLFIPNAAVSWRRLHDTDRSGWWIGAPLIALLASIFLIFMLGFDTYTVNIWMGLIGIAFMIYLCILLVFMCIRGNVKANRFG
jgi:uncharacterized membrane protein YhaH (DUF805 family)